MEGYPVTTGEGRKYRHPRVSSSLLCFSLAENRSDREWLNLHNYQKTVRTYGILLSRIVIIINMSVKMASHLGLVL